MLPLIVVFPLPSTVSWAWLTCTGPSKNRLPAAAWKVVLPTAWTVPATWLSPLRLLIVAAVAEARSPAVTSSPAASVMLPCRPSVAPARDQRALGRAAQGGGAGGRQRPLVDPGLPQVGVVPLSASACPCRSWSASRCPGRAAGTGRTSSSAPGRDRSPPHHRSRQPQSVVRQQRDREIREPILAAAVAVAATRGVRPGCRWHPDPACRTASCRPGPRCCRRCPAHRCRARCSRRDRG